MSGSPQNLSPGWPHPDAGFSPNYRRPDGHDQEKCQHRYARQGTGPYPGGLDIGFTADVCTDCGRVLRSVRDISWRDYFWVRRWNNRLER